MVSIKNKLYAELLRKAGLYDTYATPQKKYREAHKEYYKEYHRKWQQDNRERISQYQKQWRLKKKQVDLNNTCDNLKTKGEL